MSILKRIKEFATESQKNNCNGFVSYIWSEYTVKKGKQTFAVFGDRAYDVSKIKFKEGDNYGMKLFVPLHGKYLLAAPDEGYSGIMAILAGKRNGRKFLHITFSSCGGWIRTDELKLTNKEIYKKMISEKFKI